MARIQFRFWLQSDKDDELLLCEAIDELKAARQYSSAIRDGLRLVIDLRAGRLDVLQELFPFAAAAMRPAPATNGNGHSTRPAAAGDELPDLVITKASGIDPVANFLSSLSSIASAATESRQNLQRGMGNLFEDNDSDLFD